jgi:hypothetical protein
MTTLLIMDEKREEPRIDMALDEMPEEYVW